MASGTFAACSYETAPKRHNVVARLLLLPLGTVSRYVATDMPIPSNRRILGEERGSGQAWRGERRERLTSDSAAHLLSFTIRWGIVPSRGYLTPRRNDRIDLCGIGWSDMGPSWRTSARCAASECEAKGARSFLCSWSARPKKGLARRPHRARTARIAMN